MAKNLTGEQKKTLLVYCMGIIVSAQPDVLPKDERVPLDKKNEVFKQINIVLKKATLLDSSEAKFPNRIKVVYKSRVKSQDVKKELEEQLFQLILKYIPAKEFYGILNNIYKPFTDQYFNHGYDTKIKKEICRQVQEIINRYLQNQPNPKRQALKDTFKYCLRIITIFSARSYYRKQLEKYQNERVFDSIYIPTSKLNSHQQSKDGSTKKLFKDMDFNNAKAEFGLVGKNENRLPSTPFENVLFSKKGNVRKAALYFDKQPGLVVVGTKDQINRAQEKYQLSKRR